MFGLALENHILRNLPRHTHIVFHFFCLRPCSSGGAHQDRAFLFLACLAGVWCSLFFCFLGLYSYGASSFASALLSDRAMPCPCRTRCCSAALDASAPSSISSSHHPAGGGRLQLPAPAIVGRSSSIAFGSDTYLCVYLCMFSCMCLVFLYMLVYVCMYFSCILYIWYLFLFFAFVVYVSSFSCTCF